MASTDGSSKNLRFSARQARVGLAAGAVASVVEMIPVLTIQGLLGISPLRVFQSIAGGLMGAAAYDGGLATALLGGFLHVLISLVAGLAYAMAAVGLGLMTRPVLGGIAAGAVSYVVMTFIVIPLSAVPFPANRDPALMAVSLAVHIVAFGIPIAWVCRRMLTAKD